MTATDTGRERLLRFLQMVNVTPHNGYEGGVAWIEQHGGECLSTRRGIDGRLIETWRVKFPDRWVLLTYGQCRINEWSSLVD
jgi:hypothetical protein